MIMAMARTPQASAGKTSLTVSSKKNAAVNTAARNERQLGPGTCSTILWNGIDRTGDQGLAAARCCSGQENSGPARTSSASFGSSHSGSRLDNDGDAARAVECRSEAIRACRPSRCCRRCPDSAKRKLRGEIDQANQNARRKHEGADSRKQIVPLPAQTFRIGVDAPRHAHQSGDMHRKKGDVEADEHERRRTQRPSRSDSGLALTAGAQ